VDLCLPFYTFCVAGMTSVYHHTQLWVRWDLTNLLPSWP
jgi:hypothetical protein